MSRRIMIVGQAPARSGDGRPFTGPSGTRLVKLLGLEDYDDLAKQYELRNLIPDPVEKTPGKGDVFDLDQARRGAKQLIHEQLEPRFIVACGKSVFRCLTGRVVSQWFQQQTVPAGRVRLYVYAFPHPSGVSRFWNDQANFERARRFLIDLEIKNDRLNHSLGISSR